MHPKASKLSEVTKARIAIVLGLLLLITGTTLATYELYNSFMYDKWSVIEPEFLIFGLLILITGYSPYRMGRLRLQSEKLARESKPLWGKVET